MPVSKTNKNSTVLIKIQKETRGKSYSRNAFGLDWTPLKDPFSCELDWDIRLLSTWPLPQHNVASCRPLGMSLPWTNLGLSLKAGS